MGIFTGDGRVGRLHYFLINLAIGLGWLVCVLALMQTDPVTGTTSTSPMIIVVFPIVIWLSVGNTVRRLHDRDHSGWLWLVSFIPLVGLFFGLYLLFAPGDEMANRFGPPPGGVDQGQIEAKRQELEELQSRVQAVTQRNDETYYREDGSFDMDWLTRSVPGLDQTPPSSPPSPSDASPPGPPTG